MARKLRVATLETLFTANVEDVDKAEKHIKVVGQRVESKTVVQKVGADEKDALAGMGRVEDAAKKLVSERAVIKLDADITRTEASLQRAVDKLEDLHIRAEGGLDVRADVSRAEANIQRIERSLDGLKKARNVVDVDVDPEPAESGLKRFLSLFRKSTDDAGQEGGRSLSDGLDRATRGAGEKVGQVVGGDIEGSLIAALTAIPIAGGIVLGGVAIGKAIIGGVQDGLAQEQTRDRLQALTGIEEDDAARLARIAGEAYTNNFGESIESNMRTSRLALQFGILDPEQSNRDAQRTIEGLAGIADVLEEDVQPTATAVATLLRTGLAKDAQDAYDLIAAGARNGLNRNEDLLDTLTEYPVVLRRLGLDGSEALGLLNQGLEAGARNTDVIADALKEFQIRATDASDLSAAGFERLGFNASEMTAKIARGGADAREGLDEVLRKLRETEDPVVRNAAAVELFGTKAEDLGDALFALDLSSAVDQLDGVSGSAQRMFDTIADNDASRVQQAQRNIEVAADGIKGALATAFSEPLGDAATWISQNRGPVLQFFLDMANGALDFAETASDSWGDFASGPLKETLQGLRDFIEWLPGDADLDGLDSAIDSLGRVDETTDAMSDKISQARDQLNKFAEPQVALGFLNDASLRLAGAIDQIGTSAEDGRSMLEDYSEAQDGSARISGELSEQVWQAVDAMNAEQQAAADARESQDELNERWNAGREALIGQLEQMGILPEKAAEIVDAYDRIPPTKTTTVTADTSPAEVSIAWLTNPDRFKLNIPVFAQQSGSGSGVTLDGGTSPRARTGVGEFRHGGIVLPMADGGVLSPKPMDPIAQEVPPGTYRVVGDRTDVPEAFVPIDGSPRSIAIQQDLNRRQPAGAGAGGVQIHAPIQIAGGISEAEVRAIVREEARGIFGSAQL